MNEQVQLKEALSALLEVAKASGQKLTRAQIEDACEGIGLDDTQLEFVCAYLQMNHVEIDGFEATAQEKRLFGGSMQDDDADSGNRKKYEASKEEAAYFQMYLDELGELCRYQAEEEEELLSAMLAGDEQAKKRLIEGNLERVVSLAEVYMGKGVLASDLIQEGNMALILAMDSYEMKKDFALHLNSQIESALLRTVEEQAGSDEIGDCLAADANALLTATENLAEELGREATEEELAARMHISADRVETLVKLSLDAMKRAEE